MRRRMAFLIGCIAVLSAAFAATASGAAPATPTGLRVQRVTTTTIELAWKDVARGETYYGVRYRASGAAAWSTVRLPANSTAWTHTGLGPGTTLTHAVRACNAVCSPWSASVSATTASSPQPPPQGGPTLGGCPMLPADNPWNRDISQDPVDPKSGVYIQRISSSGALYLHPDFGSNPDYGIPFVVVPSTQPSVPITYTAYGDESDPGPFPVPLNAPVEAGSDRHVLVLQQGACKLYELFAAQRAGSGWNAASGAMFDLRSNALRPDTWTSADAAGLPILPGLARYDEVAAGAIRHALRFTVAHAQRAFIHPATHYGSSTNPHDPPMGLRLRLKASFDVSGYHGEARVVLDALKRYGMIVADQGTSWYITGATDSRWDDADLDQLKRVPGSAFEVVQSGPVLKP